MWIIKIIKIECSYPPRILNEQRELVSICTQSIRDCFNFPCISTLTYSLSGYIWNSVLQHGLHGQQEMSNCWNRFRNISGLIENSYEEQLKELALTTLKDRRLKTDLIQTFKILQKGFDKVNSNTWFSFVESTQSRVTIYTSYPLNLQLEQARTEKNLFSVRIDPIEMELSPFRGQRV